MKLIRLLVLILLTAATSKGFAQVDQVYLSGFTRDSLSLEALPYVNVSKDGKVLAASDSYGSYTLNCLQGDTVVFTRLGYKPYILVVRETSWDRPIFLVETARMLQGVTIYDQFKVHGQDQFTKSVAENAVREASPFNNFTMKPEHKDRMIQTFGPSVTMGAPWNRFIKSEKEKRKLAGVLDESERTKVYREFIHSAQVKQFMIRTFELTEEGYLKNLEAFILANPDAQYLQTRTDIVNLMIATFASKK